MTFIWPAMLIGLVLIPLFVGIYIRMQQRRRRLAAQYGTPARPATGAGRQGRRPGSARRRHIPPLLFLVALGILIVALARPQTLVSLPRLEGTVILAFDVSGSMAADDVKPSRLEAAKTAARAFVQDQPATVQIGVVTFSDGGIATQAPTNDQGPVLAAINRLGVQRGTSVASGIQSALKAIDVVQHPLLTLANQLPTPAATPTPVSPGTYTSAVIVLLTDGETTAGPDPLAAAQTAADRGVRIYPVGIGSTAGATLHLNGFTVVSRLDEQTLQQIAARTGGTYYSADKEEDLHTIYDHLDPQLVIKPQQTEVTALFAGAGILVLLIGGTLSLWWLGRLP
ncbi:MAG TPA: VWA domain-containing protein [Chloroflexia bacterium]|nr:VWA domain-containing protein [Chloroflexia bacterium]